VNPGPALYAEFTDPRLVALYDTVCPFAADTEFFLGLAGQLTEGTAGTSQGTIVDVGCGTGLLTAELARRGHRVTGLDPAPQMLAVARRRPGGERARWVAGYPDALAAGQAGLVLMTGHVAQVIASEPDWRAALAGAYRVLRPGGRLAFDSRDPAARAWTGWTREASSRRLEAPGQGPFELWTELTSMRGGLAEFTGHYWFGPGRELVSRGTIRFRTAAELERSLAGAGFRVEQVYGDWDGRPPGPGTPELITVAVRDPA
jgi:SAM-dependent methyltransferase